MADCKPDFIFEDNVMKVQYVPIARSEIGEENDDERKIDNEKDVQVGSNGIPVSCFVHFVV